MSETPSVAHEVGDLHRAVPRHLGEDLVLPLPSQHAVTSLPNDVAATPVVAITVLHTLTQMQTETHTNLQHFSAWIG